MEGRELTETKLMVSGIGGLLLTTDGTLADTLAQEHDIGYNNTSVVSRKYLAADSTHPPQYYVFNFPKESYELFEHVQQAADDTTSINLEDTEARPRQIYGSALREFRLSALRSLSHEQSPLGLGAYHEYYSYQWIDDLVSRNDLPVIAELEDYLDEHQQPRAHRWYSDMRSYMTQERDANLIDYFLFQIGKHATGQARIDHAHEQRLRETWPFYQTNPNNA